MSPSGPGIHPPRCRVDTQGLEMGPKPIRTRSLLGIWDPGPCLQRDAGLEPTLIVSTSPCLFESL